MPSAGEAVTVGGPMRRTDANAGGGSGPRSAPPPFLGPVSAGRWSVVRSRGCDRRLMCQSRRRAHREGREGRKGEDREIVHPWWCSAGVAETHELSRIASYSFLCVLRVLSGGDLCHSAIPAPVRHQTAATSVPAPDMYLQNALKPRVVGMPSSCGFPRLRVPVERIWIF